VGNNGQNEGFYVWNGLNSVEDMAIVGAQAVLCEGYAGVLTGVETIAAYSEDAL